MLNALVGVPELADRYVGKVKLVYIDPPFNTAQTFANYEDNLEHSVWLTLMRDRLLNLKRLLSADGSIWVHLDDVEVHRMRCLLDEVFGAENYVAEMQWEKTYSPRNDSDGIPMVTDTILVYARSAAFRAKRLPRTQEMNARYSNPDGDPKGPWKMSDSSAPSNGTQVQHPSTFGIQHPITGEMVYPSSRRCWSFSQKKMLEIMRGWGRYEYGEFTPEEKAARETVCGPGVKIREDVKPLVIPGWGEKDVEYAQKVLLEGPWPVYTISQKGSGFGRKVYLSEVSQRVPVNLLSREETDHTDAAKKEVRALFPGRTPFSTPKPERLLERIIHIASDPGDIVLDCFAGSGTTAAVAQKMGRRWVTCELLTSTFNSFTRPRLEKVVNGEDPGGITRSKGERLPADGVALPEGMSASEAQTFNALLNRVLKENPEVKNDAAVKALKAATKTVAGPEVINWRGGGGFEVAHLAPPCYHYDPELELTTLSEAATGQALIESVAANLGFHLEYDDLYFDGRRGRTVLKVCEGVLTTGEAEQLLRHLRPGESMVVAAIGLADGAAECLRKSGTGSRAVHIPEDIFPYRGEGQE
ncbi:site-specific DNA-methyltransferase [Dermabacteraceae bacterium CCM 9519]